MSEGEISSYDSQRKVHDEQRFQSILGKGLVSTLETYTTGQALSDDVSSVPSATASHR
jgi:hypothetical protein